MKKIKTIFERINHKVIDCYVEPIEQELKNSIATEKLDGTNVRITVRNNLVVRVEKRRNPNKTEKELGIIEPWYVDACITNNEDKWIFDGVKNTDFKKIPDGEWSGELVGPKINGNPLNLDNNRIVFFSLGQCPIFDNVPITYQELKNWLPLQKSKYGNNCGIEGIVWHCKSGKMYKIKNKDF